VISWPAPGDCSFSGGGTHQQYANAQKEQESRDKHFIQRHFDDMEEMEARANRILLFHISIETQQDSRLAFLCILSINQNAETETLAQNGYLMTRLGRSCVWSDATTT
jgi:hypothetical protein